MTNLNLFIHIARWSRNMNIIHSASDDKCTFGTFLYTMHLIISYIRIIRSTKM